MRDPQLGDRRAGARGDESVRLPGLRIEDCCGAAFEKPHESEEGPTHAASAPSGAAPPASWPRIAAFCMAVRPWCDPRPSATQARKGRLA
jgi:hypothetical protein